MTGPYPLVVITPTETFEISLRRYAGHPKPFESAQVVIGAEEHPEWTHHGGDVGVRTVVERDDPRWPTHSASGYAFQPDDHWQINSERLWRHPDGQRCRVDTAPPGSCYEAPPEWEWAHAFTCSEYQALGGARGTYWIRLPDGTWWSPDSVASNGNGASGWTVSGTLPLISVTPSIATPGYHGWVGVNGTAPGHLSGDLDGRPL